MTYVPASESFDGVARVIYKAKDGRTTKTFLALDWLNTPDPPYTQ